MTDPYSDSAAPAFDLATVARSLWLYRRGFGVWTVAAVLVAVLAGLAFGSREYESETMLLYRPRRTVSDENPAATGDPSLSVETLIGLVKVRSNLEEVRRRLGVAATLEELGAAVDVSAQRDTRLIRILVRWRTAEGAAAIANNLREVFVERQQVLRDRQMLVRIQGDFLAAEVESRQLAAQSRKLDTIIAGLEHSVTKELAGSAQTEGLEMVNIRIERLRRAIRDDQTHRFNLARDAHDELAYQRAEQLHAQGLVSDAELRESGTRYEQSRALTLETPQIRAWKQQLEQLQSAVIPSDGSGTRSAGLLREVMALALSIGVDQAAAEERLTRLGAERLELAERLRPGAPSRDRPSPDSASELGLRTVAQASVPTTPSRSNRRLLALGVLLALWGSGAALLLGLVLLDPTVRSAAEVRLKHSLEVLAVLPTLDPGASDSTLQRETEEGYRLLAHRLRRALPRSGSRLLVSSGSHGEGKTTVVKRLASTLGGLGENVLVIDASIIALPPGSETPRRETRIGRLRRRWRKRRLPAQAKTASVATLIPPGQESVPDLASYLDGTTGSWRDTVCATTLPGVSVIASRSEDPTHDSALLSNFRMRALLEEASDDYGIVLVDGPPMTPYATAEGLASLVDGALLVAASGSTRRASVDAFLSRLENLVTPVVGMVLNRTPPYFMDAQ